MNAFTERETEPNPAGTLAIGCVPLCSGRGQDHTNEKDPKKPEKRLKPYTTLTWTAIKSMVDTPQEVDKSRAQWLIPSAVLSRNFKQQETEGEFWLLWADIDHNPDGLDRVAAVVGLITGDAGFDFEVYTSKSATEANVKCRVLIPLAAPLSGADWILAQEVFNDLLEKHGIAPDRASERAAQLLYLPNRGDLYRNLSYRDGRFFDPLTEWAAAIEARQQAIAKAEAEAIARQAAAKSRRATLQLGQHGSAIAAFNSVYSVEEMLLRNDYAQRGNKYRHPASESGNFSASVLDGRVHSLSSADKLYTKGGGVGAHDAFSVFAVLEHGGDQKAALRDACDRMLVINGESWTAASRKAHAQEKTQAPPPTDDWIGVQDDLSRDTDVTRRDKTDGGYPLSIVFADDLSTEYEPVDELIEDVITAEDGSVLYGDSNSGKTFLAIDMAAAVARGVEWMGKKTEKGAVLYLAAESPSSVRRRLQAYKKHHGCTVPNFAIVQNTIDLFSSDKDTNRIIALVRQLEAERGMKVRLIVGDTLARLSAGANENAGQDMGLVVRRFDRIRHESKAHFLLIHHSGKNAAAGGRGWSGVRAAIETEIEVTDAIAGRAAEIMKQRDLSSKGDRIGFRLDPVTLGLTKWGKPATSCIVVAADAPVKQPAKRMGEVEGAVVEFLASHKVGIKKSVVVTHFAGRYEKGPVYRAMKSLVTAAAIHEAAGMVCIATAAK